MTKQQMTEYSVPLKNEPGAHFRVTQALAKAGVNVTAVHTQSFGGLSILRFLTDKENAAVRRPLEAAGYGVIERRVFQIDLPNLPGELNRLCRALAEEDIAIDEIYGTADGIETAKLVLSVQQPEKASSVLSRFTERAALAA